MQYREGHIPGARYASLDLDLSAIGAGEGRHPLPERSTFRRRCARWGIEPGKQVVAYDDSGGIYAARLWWMLRWIGHAPVAVLDGGLARWRAEGGVLVPDDVVESRSTPTAAADGRKSAGGVRAVSSEEVLRRLEDPRFVLIDARAASRFRGEEEPLDAVAGHVPGAVNLPFRGNLDSQGRFQDATALRKRFLGVLDGRDPRDVVHMCGSGVTACHNLLAMEHAGLQGSSLYAGSWSAWISERARPVATGP